MVGLLAFKVQGSICMHMQIRIAAREMGYIFANNIIPHS